MYLYSFEVLCYNSHITNLLEDRSMTDYKKLQNGSDVRGIALAGVEGEQVNLTPGIACDIAHAFAPVSYTHLDVYKRQLQNQ